MDDATLRSERKEQLRDGFLLGCGLLVFGGFAAVAAMSILGRGSPPDLGPLEQEGNWIVRQVETYRTAHRSYPADLDAAKASPRTEKYGGWRYKVNEGGGFNLSIGEYGEYGFVLVRTREGGWHRDT